MGSLIEFYTCLKAIGISLRFSRPIVRIKSPIDQPSNWSVDRFLGLCFRRWILNLQRKLERKKKHCIYNPSKMIHWLDDFGSIWNFISSLIKSAKTSVSTCSRRPSMIFTLESTKITWQSSDPQKPTTHYTVFHSPSLWVKHVMNIAVISLVASKNMQGFRLISEGFGIP